MIETLSKYNVKFTDEYFKKEITIPVIYSDEYLKSKTLDLNLARLCCTFCCCSYFPKDNVDGIPDKKWRSTAFLLFANWLNYFVYQQTPFDLNELYK